MDKDLEEYSRQAMNLWSDSCTTPRKIQCWCHTCRPITLDDMRMVLCPTCGNKRCPKATDHRLECSGSNEPNQRGSIY